MVGTTTTGEPGTQAMVTDSTGAPAHTFDFVIPRGADGVDGAVGPTGPTGPRGMMGPTGPTGPCCRSCAVADLDRCANEAQIIEKINELLAALRTSGLMDL